MINRAVEKVQSGAELVDSTGAKIRAAQDAIARVSASCAIASAAAEQSEGINQVNNAVAQMDGNTQQNAALVEQAAAVAQTLTDQAKLLQSSISAFHLQAGPGADYLGRDLEGARFNVTRSGRSSLRRVGEGVHGLVRLASIVNVAILARLARQHHRRRPLLEARLARRVRRLRDVPRHAHLPSKSRSGSLQGDRQVCHERMAQRSLCNRCAACGSMIRADPRKRLPNNAPESNFWFVKDQSQRSRGFPSA